MNAKESQQPVERLYESKIKERDNYVRSRQKKSGLEAAFCHFVHVKVLKKYSRQMQTICAERLVFPNKSVLFCRVLVTVPAGSYLIALNSWFSLGNVLGLQLSKIVATVERGIMLDFPVP